MKSTLQQIPVSQLVLDPDNPRLYHLRAIHGSGPMTDSELQEVISNERRFVELLKSIKRRGVEDPISVKRMEDGRYLVHEGNRRTCVLRHLIASGAIAPGGVSYDTVSALVADESTTELEIKINKIIQQTGKKDWTPLGTAAAVHELHYEFYQGEEDIATDMQISKVKVRSFLKNYRMFMEYIKKTGDTNERRFTYFADAPKKVMNWVEESKTNKEYYYEWINPTSGKAKIRAAAAGRSSLREFAKCIEDEEAMELLREDPTATVEDAYEVVKSNDIMKDMLFLSRVLPMAKSMRELNEVQLAKISASPKLKQHIKSLKFACDFILRDIEEMEASLTE